MDQLASLLLIGMAVLCLLGAYQKLRDRAAPRRLPGLRQRIMTPVDDPVGYRLSIAISFFLALVFSVAAYLTAFP